MYLVGRFTNSFNNSMIDDLDILDEQQANVGPGLAANYWFRFLEFIFKDNFNFREKMSDHLKDVKERIMGKKNYFDLQSENISAHYKFIILLPSDCVVDKSGWEREGVFKHVPGYCPPTCEHQKFEGKYYVKHDIPVKLDNNTQSLHVHWIFRHEEDEEEFLQQSEHQRSTNNKEKILVVLDFPQLLKSAMGPRKGWEEHERPGARRKNLSLFRKMINSCIESKYMTNRLMMILMILQCLCLTVFRDDVVFLKYCNDEERREKLSVVIRRMILKREDLVSSSGSDSEA